MFFLYVTAQSHGRHKLTDLAICRYIVRSSVILALLPFCGPLVMAQRPQSLASPVVCTSSSFTGASKMVIGMVNGLGLGRLLVHAEVLAPSPHSELSLSLSWDTSKRADVSLRRSTGDHEGQYVKKLFNYLSWAIWLPPP